MKRLKFHEIHQSAKDLVDIFAVRGYTITLEDASKAIRAEGIYDLGGMLATNDELFNWMMEYFVEDE